jgi:nitrogen fixation/metabolism regulation signal transduction histidine kinase
MAEYYFDKGYKKRFIIRFVVGMVMISLTSCLLFFSIIPKETASRYVSLIYHMHSTHQNLLTILLVVGLFEVILALLFTLLLVLIISHKVGGPVYKLEQNIEQMTKGNFNLSAITFRDRDQGQVLALRFNEMIKSLRHHINEVKYSYCKVQARMNPLEKSSLQQDSVGKARMMLRMKHDLEKMQDVLGRFSL